MSILYTGQLNQGADNVAPAQSQLPSLRQCPITALHTDTIDNRNGQGPIIAQTHMTSAFSGHMLGGVLSRAWAISSWETAQCS